MKSNNKLVKQAINQHILECVTNDEGELYQTFEEAKNRLKQEFERVANHPYNLQLIPNNQARFSDYLNGLPFNFHFYYSDIADFLNGLGINPEGKEYDGDKSTKLYHFLIFKQL